MNQRSWRVALAAASALLGGLAVANSPAAPAAPPAPVLTAVGDITSCESAEDDATAKVAGAVAGPIATLGDLVEGKNPGEYKDCFAPSGWGALKARIRPAPGDNGEYGRGVGADFANATPEIDDYHAYFGAAAGKAGAAWYSYDVGTWHVISLDSICSDEGKAGADLNADGEVGCVDGAAMVEWLKADLARYPYKCTAITMHHNMIDRRPYGTAGSMEALLRPMYAAGVDLIVSGHRHTYRRYAPVNIDAVRDDVAGIRQFVVGTGGHRRNLGKNSDGSPLDADGEVLQVSHADSAGVLRLTLKAGGYDWRFAPALAGDTFTDAGSARCVGDGTIPAVSDGSSTTTTTTVKPGNGPTTSTTAPPVHTPTKPAQGSGYWMLGAEGQVYEFGEAVNHGSAGLVGATAVDLEATPTLGGYWIVDGTGAVRRFGDALELGSVAPGTMEPGEEATSLSTTPSGKGYWVFTNRGRVVPFGDAKSYGDMSEVTLNGPVLDSIPTTTGEGYYMVASDGGIFAFGDAAFHGSMGGLPLNAPVQSLVPDGDGTGYWLVASDGGLFAFDAPFKGSMGGVGLARPVTGMVRFGDGYLMVGEDGGIFNFSSKPFYGSLGDNPPVHPITAVAAR